MLAARSEVLAVGRRFTGAAGPILDGAIRRRLEAVVAARGSNLTAEARESLLEAGGRALGSGIDGVVERLDDPDVWLSPQIRLEDRREGTGRSRERAGWVSGLLGRRSVRAGRSSIGDLTSPPNRIWVALLTAARQVDPVLEEFGFEPSPTPDPGGGHFGLQPRTLTELDPTGRLGRLWRQYRDSLARYQALLEAVAGGSAAPTV